jgi:predicted Zn-dependent protease
MLRYKHLRLDQEKVEKAKKIFRAKTETEAMDRALENVIGRDQELLRRRRLMKRILELRKSLGNIREDSAEWIRLARQERNQSP